MTPRNTAARLVNSLPLLWVAMLWPAWPALRGLVEDGWYLAEMLSITGLWSVYLLVVTVAVTPASLLLARLGRGQDLGRWLIRRRRHFGLASFAYAVLHLAHYALDATALDVIWAEATSPSFAAGWMGALIFAVLAVTSNDWSLRSLGRRWKPLHRWIYPAAGAIYLHWLLLATPKGPFWLWLGLFAGAKLLHIILRRMPRRARVAA